MSVRSMVMQPWILEEKSAQTITQIPTLLYIVIVCGQLTSYLWISFLAHSRPERLW